MINLTPYAETYILDYMHKTGIPIHMKGAKYLVDAIIMYLNGTSKISAVYYQISKRYDSNPKNIEKNIRACIQKAWQTDKFNELEKLFGSKESSSPTNKEFICMMAHKVRLRVS